MAKGVKGLNNVSSVGKLCNSESRSLLTTYRKNQPNECTTPMARKDISRLYSRSFPTASSWHIF